ncbi:hypothetical protein [Ktedonospora formicarum]|uniref:Uncharacterized protein n=1 Tax=Ktedonospora formicarum TaxID=2778364 RepID=A0A8J3HT05_9CHLR|nr:hypothetical protein [Ktedonospora formicarum]GHO43427.1 hypothetical protein KSX_15900 [Ktedonospora formicarum]
MHNDSIETLLSRHYGPTAPTPPDLEQRLLAALSQEQARQTRRLAQERHSERLMTRRQVLRVVTLGSAGLGMVGLALDGVQQFDRRFFGRDATVRPQHAF